MEANPNIPYLSINGKSFIQQDLGSWTGRYQKQDTDQTGMTAAAMAKAGSLHVAIVGAGFAGLRCADVLLQRGVKVTIFEARNRLGGRVAQSKQLGHQVDLGPNWIHGTNDNPILDIARKTKTELCGMDESQHVIDADGNPLDPNEADELAAMFWDDGVIAEAFKYSNDHFDDIPPSRSLYDFFEERSKTLFTSLPPNEAERKRETFLQCANMWGSYIGSPVQQQSLKFFWLEECIEGENPFVAGTYEKILEEVSRPAREKAEILLETKVTGIHTEAGDTTPHARPTVETADGNSRTFDEVVVTVPLGYLKRNQTMFDPPLPPRLTRAISNISYGTLDKVYITFPTAFWNAAPSTSPTTSPKSLDPTHSTPNTKILTQPLHQPLPTTPPPSNPRSPSTFHFLPAPHPPPSNPSHKNHQALSLAHLPPSTAHPTLLFYTYGACSTHIASLKTTTPPSHLSPTLLAFFSPYTTRLPNYSPTDPSHQPLSALATAWAADEFAGYGSYSNFQTGLEEGGRDVEVMREGCPERGVWFAGEHAAPFVACGTSTGAYWSGEGVGERICQGFGLH